MDNDNIFFDDWMDCLREHYKDVLRRNDKVARPTLENVLLEIGFSEDELRALYIDATIRTEDMADNFVPDFGALKPLHDTSRPHPAECACPACAPLDESGHDAEGQPLASEADDDKPTQLSLF